MQITPNPLVARAQSGLAAVRAGLASRGLSAIRQAAVAATDWTRLPIGELVKLAYELFFAQSHKAEAIVEHLVGLDHADGYYLKAQLLLLDDAERDWAHIAELTFAAAKRHHANAIATLGVWLTSDGDIPTDCPFDEESNEAERWHKARYDAGIAFLRRSIFEFNDATSMHHLGLIYESEGIDGVVDHQRALHWYRRAGEAGNWRGKNSFVSLAVRRKGSDDTERTLISFIDMLIEGGDGRSPLRAISLMVERNMLSKSALNQTLRRGVERLLDATSNLTHADLRSDNHQKAKRFAECFSSTSVYEASFNFDPDYSLAERLFAFAYIDCGLRSAGYNRARLLIERLSRETEGLAFMREIADQGDSSAARFLARWENASPSRK